MDLEVRTDFSIAYIREDTGEVIVASAGNFECVVPANVCGFDTDCQEDVIVLLTFNDGDLARACSLAKRPQPGHAGRRRLADQRDCAPGETVYYHWERMDDLGTLQAEYLKRHYHGLEDLTVAYATATNTDTKPCGTGGHGTWWDRIWWKHGPHSSGNVLSVDIRDCHGTHAPKIHVGGYSVQADSVVSVSYATPIAFVDQGRGEVECSYTSSGNAWLVLQKPGCGVWFKFDIAHTYNPFMHRLCPYDPANN